MSQLDEAELLIEEAESKLESAKLLYENGRHGDAISRAYYSMHYAARALLSTKNIFPKTHKGALQKKAGKEQITGQGMNSRKKRRKA